MKSTLLVATGLSASALGLLPPPGPFASATPRPWGSETHELTCAVAWHFMTEEARDFMARIRSGDAGTFTESCNWADQVRGERPETAGFHYVNLPPGLRSYDEARDCGDPAVRCAPWAILHYGRVLADSAAPPAARLEALKFVAHFVGDIHQPLHAGRAEDRGGNDIRVWFFGDGGSPDRPMQLHHVWDTALPTRAGFVHPDAVGGLVSAITATDVKEWTASSVAEWTNESHELGESFVYRVGEEISDAYFEEAVPIVALRIRQGGARLAFLLNEAARGRPPR